MEYKEIIKIKVQSDFIDNQYDELRTMVIENFAEGEIISFYRRNSLIEAEIIRIIPGFGRHEPTFRIRNIKTNKIYLISLYWILQDK